MYKDIIEQKILEIFSLSISKRFFLKFPSRLLFLNAILFIYRQDKKIGFGIKEGLQERHFQR